MLPIRKGMFLLKMPLNERKYKIKPCPGEYNGYAPVSQTNSEGADMNQVKS